MLKIILSLFFVVNSYAYDATLEWDAYTDPNGTKINGYWQAGTEAPFVKIGTVPSNVTRLPITGMEENIQYGFYITAESDSGLESDSSNIVYYLALPRLKMSSQGLHLTVRSGNTYQILQSPDFKIWTVVKTVTATTDKFIEQMTFDSPMMFFKIVKVD